MINNITGKTNDKTSVIESIKVDNIEHYDASGITNGLCKYFANVGENFLSKIPKAKKDINEYLSKITKNNASLYMTPTNQIEICRIIDNLLHKSSSGYDNISNVLLKQLKPCLIEPLSIIFNKSISTGIFPEIMKSADVFPLYKSKQNSYLQITDQFPSY